MIPEKVVSIELSVDPSQLYLFFPLLQQGFRVKALVGCSIRNMLCEQFKLAAQVVDERIKTLFLNGQPVDDVDTAFIQENDTLALSAAMPGLVGATFRRGGCLAPFRSSISYRRRESNGSCREGFVTIKLFNLLLREVGPHFLQRGLILERDVLATFFQALPAELWAHCQGTMLDGQAIAPAELVQSPWPAAPSLGLLRILRAADK